MMARFYPDLHVNLILLRRNNPKARCAPGPRLRGFFLSRPKEDVGRRTVRWYREKRRACAGQRGRKRRDRAVAVVGEINVPGRVEREPTD